MKKTGILNAQLAGYIARLRHKERFLTGDAGMSVLKGIPVVGLVLYGGIPTFQQVVDVVLNETVVKGHTFAVEAEEEGPVMAAYVCGKPLGTPEQTIPYDELKCQTEDIKLVVRTDELTSYSNLILQAGVALPDQRSPSMKIFNFGSLNYDYVYSVDHIPLPRETSVAWRMETFIGGKGLNQSVTLACAGAEVRHAEQVGEEGGQFLTMCRESGVSTEYICQVPGKSGHMVVQVDKGGQNNILLSGGANRSTPQDFADGVLAALGEGDLPLLQNEINGVLCLIENIYARGMWIALNPPPYDEVISKCDLSKVSILLVNETEGWQISAQRKPDSILEVLAHQYPELVVVLTLGSQGVVHQHQSGRLPHGIYPVPVVDTTTVGDTLTGYFLAGMTRGLNVPQSLELASKASSIVVTWHGAAPPIPLLREVESYAF